MLKKNQVLEDLKKSFLDNQDEEFASWQKAYMLNKFDFIGLRTPTRRVIQKKIFSKYKIESEKELIEIATLLWSQKQREFQYSAIELIFKYKKLLTTSSFELVEKLIRSNSWWDTVDFIAANILGSLLNQFKSLKSKMDAWVLDDNIWIRRAALLFQLKYKNQTDSEILFNYCKLLASEKEFFTRKAIGWSLREYSKTNKEKVKNFIEKNKNILSALSIKEGSKYLF